MNQKPEQTIEKMYQETQIHFLLNPNNNNVMINATEMAKAFGKRTKDYLANQTTKEYILELERTLKSVHSDIKIVDNRGHIGIYFDRRLALDFAAWLDVKFRVWIFSTIENVIFGNYKKHWDAHARQESAKVIMEEMKNKLLLSPTQEDVIAYFESEKVYKDAKAEKTNAIRNQLKLF